MVCVLVYIGVSECLTLHYRTVIVLIFL